MLLIYSKIKAKLNYKKLGNKLVWKNKSLCKWYYNQSQGLNILIKFCFFCMVYLLTHIIIEEKKLWLMEKLFFFNN